MGKDVKVFFVQKIKDCQFETESIWCKQVSNDTFIVDNIPFIAKRISLGDTIKAEFDLEDEQYYFDDFIATSGNSTIRIYSYDQNETDDIRKWLSKHNCESEVFNSRNIIAINVPKSTNYSPIKEFLENGEKNERWSYEESCLEHT